MAFRMSTGERVWQLEKDVMHAHAVLVRDGNLYFPYNRVVAVDNRDY